MRDRDLRHAHVGALEPEALAASRHHAAACSTELLVPTAPRLDRWSSILRVQVRMAGE